MAQTGFTPIQLYRTSTAAAAPTSGNLVAGELAINDLDEKLYFKNSAGVVKVIASVAGAIGDVAGPVSATNNAVALFDGTTGKLIKDSTALLPAGAIVGTTDSQTLTNKTLTSPVISGGTVNNAVIGGVTPAAATVTTLVATSVTASGTMTTTANAYQPIDLLTDGATITPDFTVGNNFSVTLAGNRTLANPTGLTAGQSGVIFITQDATGSRTLAYGSSWDFPNQTAPSLTTTANAVDMLVFTVRSSTSIGAVLIPNIG